MFLMVVVAAQSPEPPLSNARLSIHTLVREDIFAGFLEGNLERFARGERNIDLLLEKRPAAKSELLAWKGGAALFRAVLAQENKRPAEFKRKYQEALDLFAQARETSPENGGVAAVTGGTNVLFADRLPEEYRAAAWSQAYNAYRVLWKEQGAVVDKLPVHLKGELLAGLAQSAMRTGRTEEAIGYLDQIQTHLSDTPYAGVAKKWKADPKAAEHSSITCMTCHDSGRLSARLSALEKK
jgi:tetratricopeptide (TPR) repeat protein